MKIFTAFIIAVLLTQCATCQTEKVETSTKAIHTALDAYLWGAVLVENRRVVNLDEMRALYSSTANWADKSIRAKIAEVVRKLENHDPSNGAARDKIMFIFYGVFPMSRDMSNVSQPIAGKRTDVWEVVIEGTRTQGVQRRVNSKKISYTFEIIEEQGMFRVKDVIIVDGSLRRRLSQWLDDMAK